MVWPVANFADLASILSGRLVDGNKKVVDMGKGTDLAGSDAADSSAGSKKDQALGNAGQGGQHAKCL